MRQPKITLSLDVARRLYDLATDSPLMCSGSFDSDDVAVLRQLAERIGVDPLSATPDEFVRDYPHPFKARQVWDDRQWRMGWINFSTGLAVDPPAGADPYLLGYRQATRPETDEEWAQRLDEQRSDPRCYAGTYGRECLCQADDPIHIAPWEAGK